MNPSKRTGMLKVALLISGMAFLPLIASYRISSLCGCIAAVIILGGFLVKSSLSYESVIKSLKPVHIILGAFMCSILGLNFYERWRTSAKVQALSIQIGKE